MKSEYINPFIKATQKAFRELMHVETKPGSPLLFEAARDYLEVTAIIGLAGEVTGAVILSFPSESCLRISRAFTGIQSDAVDDVAVDAVGEVVNVIAGNTKEDLLQFRIYISLPKVVFGQYDLRFPRDTPMIAVPFESDAGSFRLIVALKESPG
ncbi:MAG: chemotaxis protein CheX [Leptospiraceae bacterium]|nr:chemotaxis protein CheX [Leptospiraceae bacterium]